MVCARPRKIATNTTNLHREICIDVEYNNPLGNSFSLRQLAPSIGFDNLIDKIDFIKIKKHWYKQITSNCV